MPEKPASHKKPDKLMLYLFALVGVLIIAGVAAWFMRPENNGQSIQNQQTNSSTGSSQTKDLDRLAAQSMDVERQTDIKQLHMELDKYYTTHGMYPTLLQLNDKSWRQANMLGIEDQSLKEPEGTQAVLAGAQTEGAYAYIAAPANCDNASQGKCISYALTATLESGQPFTMKSLVR